jgi:FKBP-type peptidyl-prolyl cis-trans isomerase
MKGSGMFKRPDRFMAGAPLAILLAVTACAPAAPSQPTNEVSNQMIALPGGLKYADIKVGDGATAAAGQKISVNYTGWLSDNGVKGRKFDSSFDHGQPFSFTLGAHQVIAGWDEGVPGMKVGGKRTLDIPPDLGYGARGFEGRGIPPNATLIFDVELLQVQ